MFRSFFSLTLLLAALPVLVRANVSPLLNAAVGSWSEGKEDWAFTQRSRALADNGAVKEERLERYDPSLPDAQRWRLLEVNGQPPTEAQVRSIEQRRNNKPRRHANKPPGELLDFENARAIKGNAQTVTYEVGVRPDAVRLVQTDKLVLMITVSRAHRTIERITAGVREPMRVALGLAKITDVDFDLNFDTPAAGKTAPSEDKEEEAPAPSGIARVVLWRLGEQMEYEWSDFKRVDTYQKTKV